MNAVDRSEMATWLDGAEARIRTAAVEAATDAATLAAVEAVSNHAETCWERHLREMHDDIKSLLAEKNRAQGLAHGQAKAEQHAEKTRTTHWEYVKTWGGWLIAIGALVANLVH